MSQNGAYHAELRRQHLPVITDFCDDLSLSYSYMAGDWHIRIENVFDVYPTRNRYHWLPTGERGKFKNYEDLGRIFVDLQARQ